MKENLLESVISSKLLSNWHMLHEDLTLFFWNLSKRMSQSTDVRSIRYPNGLQSILITYAFPRQSNNHTYQVVQREEILQLAIKAWDIKVIQKYDSNNFLFYSFDRLPGECRGQMKVTVRI